MPENDNQLCIFSSLVHFLTRPRQTEIEMTFEWKSVCDLLICQVQAITLWFVLNYNTPSHVQEEPSAVSLHGTTDYLPTHATLT